jgi:hypothetical protein
VSCALWVLGEYSASREEVEAALAVIHAGLGPLPLLQLESGELGRPRTGGDAGSAACLCVSHGVQCFLKAVVSLSA